MENEISYKIIGAAIEVHRILGGPGLLEGIYESCLCHELVILIPFMIFSFLPIYV